MIYNVRWGHIGVWGRWSGAPIKGDGASNRFFFRWMSISLMSRKEIPDAQSLFMNYY